MLYVDCLHGLIDALDRAEQDHSRLSSRRSFADAYPGGALTSAALVSSVTVICESFADGLGLLPGCADGNVMAGP